LKKCLSQWARSPFFSTTPTSHTLVSSVLLGNQRFNFNFSK
jgi:hypothetical protein